MSWFRLFHGTVTDPRLRVVSRRSGQPLALVLAVWISMLESASKSGGTIRRWSDKQASVILEIELSQVRAIHQAMVGKLLNGDRVIQDNRKNMFLSQRGSIRDWPAIKLAVLERDGHACRYCGVKCQNMECDHIIPVSKGGGSDMGNLVAACRNCNRSKRDKDLQAWLSANPDKQLFWRAN